MNFYGDIFMFLGIENYIKRQSQNGQHKYLESIISTNSMIVF